jgi:hypothetical protein
MGAPLYAVKRHMPALAASTSHNHRTILMCVATAGFMQTRQLVDANEVGTQHSQAQTQTTQAALLDQSNAMRLF